MAKTVLELALTERYDVVISGIPYPLKSVLKLNVLDFQRIAAQSKRAAELNEVPTPEGIAELDSILEEMTRFILEAPDEIHQALRTDQRMAVVNVFTSLLQTPVTGSPQEMTSSPSTGANR
jgi:hypothetical protein